MSPSGTNINDAMLMSVNLLESSNKAELLPAGSVSIIILLTDGDPTVGEDIVATEDTAEAMLAVGREAGKGGDGLLRPLWF
jgi:Mg-chelatase subunit ChlD